ncbi:MAG: 8-oxo-dGTP diphosphatase [Verrucomicrobiales bacterium]|nr:8-oxo-dGTP diphosphatase [Verrucomicrobiales bacterium]
MIANLAFMVDPDLDRVLLIHKKTGLGAGKINGPGGKLEAGESALESAVRELQEELHITPTDLEEMGVLHFQFVQGLALHCTVFRGFHFTGTPTETREAKPEWFNFDRIPFDRMWQDDIYWLPKMLEGQKFDAWFHFNDEIMTGHRIDWRICD